MNKIALLIATVALLGLAQACTVSGPATGQIGQALTFTVTGLTDGGSVQSKACGGGVTPSTLGATSFTCTYTTANSYPVTAIEQQSESPTPITCTSLQTTISTPAPASNQAPTVSISSPTSGQSIASETPFTISGSATDSDGSVSIVQVQISHTAGEACGASDAWNPAIIVGQGASVTWIYSWTPPVGKTCVINVHAIDGASAQGPDASVSFRTNAPSGGSSCVATCVNRINRVCPSGAQSSVQCCSVSECSDTCVGTQYRAPISCSASNTCSYGALSSVAGRCGYSAPNQATPTCRISNAGVSGTSVSVALTYSGLSNAVGSVSLSCGNGQTEALTCSGTSGSCSSTCTYNSAGAFSPSATIQGTSCSSFSLTATGTTSSSGTTTTTNQQSNSQGSNTNQQSNSNVLACSVNSLAEAHVGDQVNIQVQYSGASLSPGVLTVACGNGRSATAPGCTSNVMGRGSCTTSCSYDAPGTYSETTSIRGVSCTSNSINVVPGASTSGSSSGNAGLQFTSSEANISIGNFATTPRTILENAATQVTALIQSNQPVKSVTCTPLDNAKSTCSCTLASTTIVNPVVDCSVQPPVSGRYQITFTGQDGKTKNAQVTLTPGQTGTIEVINRSADNNTLYAAIAVAVLLIGYGAYFAYTKLTAALTAKQKLVQRRGELLREIDFAKMSYMKGEIAKDQFQKIYANKQEEMTNVNAKISEMEKQQTQKK